MVEPTFSTLLVRAPRTRVFVQSHGDLRPGRLRRLRSSDQFPQSFIFLRGGGGGRKRGEWNGTIKESREWREGLQCSGTREELVLDSPAGTKCFAAFEFQSQLLPTTTIQSMMSD